MLSRDDLEVSIAHLWEEFGQTDSPLFGFVVNGGLGLVGVVVFLATTGLVSYAGLVWAILNFAGIVKWVFRL